MAAAASPLSPVEVQNLHFQARYAYVQFRMVLMRKLIRMEASHTSVARRDRVNQALVLLESIYTLNAHTFHQFLTNRHLTRVEPFGDADGVDLPTVQAVTDFLLAAVAVPRTRLGHFAKGRRTLEDLEHSGCLRTIRALTALQSNLSVSDVSALEAEAGRPLHTNGVPLSIQGGGLFIGLNEEEMAQGGEVHLANGVVLTAEGRRHLYLYYCGLMNSEKYRSLNDTLTVLSVLLGVNANLNTRTAFYALDVFSILNRDMRQLHRCIPLARPIDVTNKIGSAESFCEYIDLPTDAIELARLIAPPLAFRHETISATELADLLISLRDLMVKSQHYLQAADGMNALEGGSVLYIPGAGSREVLICLLAMNALLIFRSNADDIALLEKLLFSLPDPRATYFSHHLGGETVERLYTQAYPTIERLRTAFRRPAPQAALLMATIARDAPPPQEAGVEAET